MFKRIIFVGVSVFAILLTDANAQLSRRVFPAAGDDGQIQINSSRRFSGDTGLTFDTATNDLTVSGAITAGGDSEIAFSNGIILDGSTANLLGITGGNVGFGTNSPTAPLEVIGKVFSLGTAGLTTSATNLSPQLLVRKTGGYSLSAAGISVVGSDNFGGAIVMAQDTGASLASGRYLGQLLFTGSYDGTHALANSGAAIFGVTTESWGTSATTGTKLVFETATNGAAFRTPKMVLGNDGFLGVGTSSPTALVDSSSSTGGDIQVSRADTSVTAGDVIGSYKFKGNDTQSTTQSLFGKIEMTATNTISTDASAGDMTFYTTGTAAGGSPAARMTILNDGKVGIGTTSPSTNLHVVGGARVTNLVSCDTIDTDANGVMSCGSDSGAGGGAPIDATYITQTPDSSLSNEQSLSSLSDGIMRVATTTGVITSLGDVLPVANGGTNSSSASINAFNNITGLSAAGTTGTTSTNIVFSTSPTLVTPVLGTATCTQITANSGTVGFSGNSVFSNSGNTTGAAFSATQNSLTSGSAYSASTNNGSFSGNLITLSNTGSGSGRTANFSSTNASASGQVLRVYNLGTGNSFVVEDDTTTDSTPFVIDASGNVGVKTSSPAKDLDVTGEIRASSSITSTATSDIGWSIQTGANTACNTTCTNACVHGWDTSSGEVAVSCSDATADKCLCAGAS